MTLNSSSPGIMMGIFYVYIISSNITGKICYVGKTNNLKRRWKEHRMAVASVSPCPLYRALRKYGVEAFKFEPLATYTTEEIALDNEVALIRSLRESGVKLYNLTDGGEGLSGFSPSAETRAKLSAIFKGRKFSPETLARMSAGQKGRVHSPETRMKLSKINKGRVQTLQHRTKRAAAQIGRRYSPETIAKMSASHKGKKMSAEARMKMSMARRGKKRPEISIMLKNRNMSLEHRAKVSAALKGRPKSPEHIAKVSAALKERYAANKGKEDLKNVVKL